MCALDVSSDAVFSPAIQVGSSTLEPTPKPPSLSLMSEYRITHRQASESAWIFFIEDNSTQKHMVAKVLRQYKDLRYDLSDVTNRQRCQLEAFHLNRMFTPEVYIGLAKLYNEPGEEHSILLGTIIEHPSPEVLEKGAEYALIMERLPDDRRLDQLLTGDDRSVQDLLAILTRHIVELQEIHAPPLAEQQRAYWGSYATLQGKLEENLAFLSLIRNEVNSSLSEMIEHLSARLREIFTKEHFSAYLEERVKLRAIKRCHGDIKSLNIWIVPGDQPQKYSVKLLDAIDFNPLFNNIDILSDFAMLVVDVWARTQSDKLAGNMIDRYLELTNQNNSRARMLFDYYLIEKAIVASTINILFDNQRTIGLRLLDLAQERLQRLSDQVLYQLA